MVSVFSIGSIVRQLLLESPLYIVYLVGFIFALVRWRRHPRASLLTLIGVLIAGFTSLFFAVVYGVLPEMDIDFEYFSVFGMARNLIDAVALAFIVAAVFVSRRQPPLLARYDDPDYPLPEELTRPGAKPANDAAYRQGK